ncbi:DUF2384 domain-containing protein, partial [bacterium]|nr:DUF2384 domain-containing protein [bacterium]
MLESRLYQAALDAARAFLALELWEECTPDDTFAVVAPGEALPMFANVMGQGREEFGLILFRGAQARADILDMLVGDPAENARTGRAAFLSVSEMKYGEMAPMARRFLAKARFTGRASDTVPLFLAKDADRPPRAFTRGEVEIMLHALRGILDAHAAGQLAFSPVLDESEVNTLVISGELPNTTFTVEQRTYDAPASDDVFRRVGDRMDIDTDVIPEADDLERWKACDHLLYQRAMRELDRDDRLLPDALACYFGDEDVGWDFLGDEEDNFADVCFAECRWLDCRHAEQSTTPAERMLAGGLPRAERRILEARVRAAPSIYRMDAVDAGVSLTLVDVLFGGSVLVHDANLATTAAINMAFPARIFPVGSFHFAGPLGPLLDPLEIDVAIEYLQDIGLDLTPEGTRSNAHLFGRLWEFLDDAHADAAPPRVQNTDGDELCFHTATYRVADEGAARAVIGARDDVDDTDPECIRWVRHDSADRMTALASLRFTGDELLVETNSAERSGKIRAWLDSVPGIAYETVRTRDMDTVRNAPRPPDDRLAAAAPVEITPEIAAGIEAIFHQQYMAWLDKPVPALGDKTPREACRTEAGKQRVARLIRAIPAPFGPHKVE